MSDCVRPASTGTVRANCCCMLTPCAHAGAVKPIAHADTFASLPHDAPSVLPVFANDASAIPGHVFKLWSTNDVTWAVPGPPAHGTLSRTPSGDALVYTPRPGTAPGTADSFRYRAFDCHGESELATVMLQLAAAPPAAYQSVEVSESASAASLVQQILLENMKKIQAGEFSSTQGVDLTKPTGRRL